MLNRVNMVSCGRGLGGGGGHGCRWVDLQRVQRTCLLAVVLFQICCIVQGFPTKEEDTAGKDRAAFTTLVNTSTHTVGSEIHYTGGNLLTTLDGITDKTEDPTMLTSKPRDKSKNVQAMTEKSTPSSSLSSSSSSSSSSIQSSSLKPLSKTSSKSQTLFTSPGSSDQSSPLPSLSRTRHTRLDESETADQNEDAEDDILPVEQRLMNRLLRNYERSVRPVKNASDIVLVRMGLTLTQIFDMDEKNQVLVTNVWLDQEWDDMFLTWAPEEYGGLRVLRLPCHKIWLPDIVLYNNAAEYTDGLMPANAMITNEGNVFWPVPTKLQSTCKVDVTYFPFDDQYCRLKFGSWTYDGFQVDMVNRTTEVDLSNYVENGEWELMAIHVQRNVVYYACCPEPFPDVTFVIHIRRRTLYYMYNVIFPCIMMSALTLLVFCLPPDSGEKITMGITVLLAFSVFMLTIAEDLPETSEFIPLLSIYLTIVMAMTSVSVIMTVFVLNLHHRGPNNKPVPNWLRKLLLRKRVSRGLCFSKHGTDTRFVDQFLSDGHSNYIKNVSLRLTIENLAQELKEEFDNCTSELGATESPSGTAVGFEGQYHEVPQSEHSLRSGLFGKHQCTKTNEEILNALKKIIERYERDDNEEEVMYEWRQVALAVDRVLFWVFLFGTLASTIIVLIVAPITKWL